MHRILRGAIDAIDPVRLVTRALSEGALDSVHHRSVNLLAAGKAAWPMAAAFADASPLPIRAGVVTGTRVAGCTLPDVFDVYDGGHPTPTDDSERAGLRAARMARDRDAALIVLLSGGASAMLAAPAEGISLDDKGRTTHCLLRAGMSIAELNCVRKHLSAIKGGQLAAAAVESVTLAISDVHGPVPDDPSIIGSGPTVPDPSTFAQALAIVHRVYADDAAELPRAVLRRLERGAHGEIPETPKPGDMRLLRSRYTVIGNRAIAMEGAAAVARALGYVVKIVDRATCGEARIAGHQFAAAAASCRTDDGRPFCVIASGETTVRVRGGGHGGRNLEFALAMAPTLDAAHRSGQPVVAASIGTDGVDGPTDAAGAVVDGTTLERAQRGGLSADAALARNDTHPFFQQLDDLVVWGPTGTNVGDLHVLLSTSAGAV